jgi:hypothetical protein
MGAYVVTSTPRDNATIFNPIGMVAAQTTRDEVLVKEIDLSYAVLHWAAGLKDGKAFDEAYGDKAGYVYSPREDTGVFWSNDPNRTIGSMVRELGFIEMQAQTIRDGERQDKVRGGPVRAPSAAR